MSPHVYGCYEFFYRLCRQHFGIIKDTCCQTVRPCQRSLRSTQNLPASRTQSKYPGGYHSTIHADLVCKYQTFSQRVPKLLPRKVTGPRKGLSTRLNPGIQERSGTLSTIHTQHSQCKSPSRPSAVNQRASN